MPDSQNYSGLISKGQIRVTLLNFCVAALMGVTLRSQFLFGLPFNYRFLTHAHSHLVLLGWVYLIVFVFVNYHFLDTTKNIRRLFWVTQLAVVGMAISFPIQGYALYSIIFSTLHIFSSYAFAGLSWKQLRKLNSQASQLILTGLGFMLLSTLGVWALAPIMVQNVTNTAAYPIAIQFFLHFQLNGWFWFAGLGIGWVYLEKRGCSMSKSLFNKFYLLSVIGVLFTVGLPINGYAPHLFWYLLNAFGALCLSASVFLFLKFLIINLSFKPKNLLLNSILIITVLVSIAAIVIIRLFGISQAIARSAIQNQSWKIGFVHLLMLGVVSSGFIYFIQKEIQTRSAYFTVGVIFFVVGFTLTEILLFLEGWLVFLKQGSLPSFYESLWLLSIFLFIGVLGITLGIWSAKSTYKNQQTGG